MKIKKVALLSLTIFSFILQSTYVSATEEESVIYSSPTTVDCPVKAVATESTVIEIPKYHTHAYVETVIPPTCLEEGYTEYKCECGHTYRDNVIAPLGHKESSWIVDRQPTENSVGYRHTECERCGVVIRTSTIPKLPPKETTPEPEQEPPVHIHQFTEKIEEPTCEKRGNTEYTCECGYSYKDNYVPATGHKESDWIIEKEPTLITEGWHYKECIICHKRLLEEEIPRLTFGGEEISKSVLIVTTASVTGFLFLVPLAGGIKAYQLLLIYFYLLLKKKRGILGAWISDDGKLDYMDIKKHPIALVKNPKTEDYEFYDRLSNLMEIHHSKIELLRYNTQQQSYDQLKQHMRCDGVVTLLPYRAYIEIVESENKNLILKKRLKKNDLFYYIKKFKDKPGDYTIIITTTLNSWTFDIVIR